MSGDSHYHLDSLSHLISFTGINIPERAKFVAQFIGSTLFASLTTGLVAGQAGALLPCGPLAPFIAGSWFGYTWGCVGCWKRSKNKALACARRYPRILAHGLLVAFDVKVPPHVETDGSARRNGQAASLEQWILDGGVGRVSYAILAAHSCEEDIAATQKSERQKLVDKYSE